MGTEGGLCMLRIVGLRRVVGTERGLWVLREGCGY